LSNVPAKASVPNELAEIKAKLAEAEAKVAELTRSQEEGANQKSVRPSENVVKGDGYKFEVGPRNDKTGLAKKHIVCCDESEAIRWYIATTEDPTRRGKQVDPVKVPLMAVCVDRKRREEEIKKQKRRAFLRGKIDNGHPISNDEIAELEKVG
jgi:hypothetical protein